MSPWKIEYDNDTGQSDDGFREWWTVSNGEESFTCDSDESATWLCAQLAQRDALLAACEQFEAACYLVLENYSGQLDCLEDHVGAVGAALNVGGAAIALAKGEK